ncbi:MAG: RnfABCDGE type electron transport complex subunit D [Clostridia bacterium]|nr:RnfABCDGE type electron transport complex subunit D [Clostridia bacterium]
MEKRKYLVSATPHIRRRMSVEIQYLILLLALVPSVVSSIIFHTFPALLILSVSILSCYVFDMFFSFIFLGHFSFRDFSSVITGLVLGLVMPVQIPIYFLIIASLISTLVAKVLFGGEGKELVHGAAFGACVISALVAGFGTTLVAYSGVVGEVLSPLEIYAESGYGVVPILDLFLGNAGGMLGTTCAIASIVGFLILSISGVFDFYIPVLSIVAFVIVTIFTKGVEGILPELLTGSFLFVSVFMLPSHSSSPALWPAKAAYSVLFGALAAAVRVNYLFGEAGVLFCLLLMNILSPLLDMLASVFFRGRRAKKYE